MIAKPKAAVIAMRKATLIRRRAAAPTTSMSPAPSTVPGDHAAVRGVLPRVGQQVDDDEREHRAAGKREGRRQQTLDLLDREPCDERARHLRHARQHGAPELLGGAVAGGLHRRGGRRSLGHVLDRDRGDDERADADLVGREGARRSPALRAGCGRTGRR